MSKKIKTTNDAITATTNEVVNETPSFTGETLEGYLIKYPNVSLRKLALSLEISYGWILKCSKKPIPGKPYDPDEVNYDAVAEVFSRKGIDLAQLDWETLNESTQTSRGISLTKDMSAFQVGGKVYLREDNEVPFEICYKTDSHIVIMKEGSTEPRAWSHSTFLMKGPVFEPRTVHTNHDEDNEEAVEA